MIKPAEQQLLAAFLFDALPINVTGGVITEYLGPGAGANLGTIDKVQKVAEWMVDQVLRLPSSEMFIAMVEKLSDADGALAGLLALAEDLRQGRRAWAPLVAEPTFDWALEADPLAIRDGRPFVDRSGFRQLLPRKGGAASPACVVVSGDPGDGKSYLRDFCEAFATARQGFRVGHSRSGGSGSSKLDARTVARELSLGLGVRQQIIPPRHEEPQRDAENLAAWIARYTPEGPVPAVAIIDELDRGEIAEPVHRFILALATRLREDAEVRSKLTLVLIGYDPSRLQKAGIAYAQYVLEPVEPADISAWFRRSFPGHEDYRYDSAAEEIHGSVSQCPPDQRMLTLNQEIRAVAQDF